MNADPSAASDPVDVEVMPEKNQGGSSDEDLRAELESLREQLADAQDKFLRAKAETENVRRRAENDVINARKYGIEKFAAEVLTIRDSLEMARSIDIKGENREVLEKMHEGLDLTLKQLDSIFEKFQMEMLSPHGEKFNPDQHQAISMIESPDVAANHVVSVVQKGCTISDRLLRPALVVVSNGQGKKAENGQESEENDTKSA